ncbi:hypothetical protein E2C01_033111 [Portunus trituberculatus]|uniref:Uncharacterized protein n=1 Tax=Portunus trituberculatus TaxID=210409 RepID=A0A5B7F2W3_PORTR|nr:hypothetical protein [Portunus trituberculatus]
MRTRRRSPGNEERKRTRHGGLMRFDFAVSGGRAMVWGAGAMAVAAAVAAPSLLAGWAREPTKTMEEEEKEGAMMEWE